MSFTNSYTPPLPHKPLDKNELYGPEPYDINFVYPLHLPSLETPRVKLTPFIPRVHGDHFWSQVESNLELFRYYPFTFPSKEDFLTLMEVKIRQNPNNVLLAIIDKTKPDLEHPEFEGGSFAGLIGLINSVPANLCTEIGFVAVLPPFQRTHVASNAVGAILKYCLELPSAEFPGLGLRRVEWKAHSKNLASARLAERMGFSREGLLRWQMAVPPALAKDGKKPRDGDKWPDHYGRDTVILSVSWEDWVNGVNGVAQKNVDRI
ncbi:acyl-CoA N-acyltransferase [Irpex rosettiformis]|uniref:Acyl-CoA N-acyltransferase n=1 Tax=Irpex rosettiformis TaxID=378272 RepID=A0ACB8TW11_9APHY|nr:acyl-CoA N-acyltransferase [Irpex rosettiformis]